MKPGHLQGKPGDGCIPVEKVGRIHLETEIVFSAALEVKFSPTLLLEREKEIKIKPGTYQEPYLLICDVLFVSHEEHPNPRLPVLMQ